MKKSYWKNEFYNIRQIESMPIWGEGVLGTRVLVRTEDCSFVSVGEGRTEKLLSNSPKV